MAQSYDLGGGGNAFPFDTVGAFVEGKIVNITEEQQTDMDNGQPLFWDNNQPKMMVHVELQTELRDPGNPGDDGKRSVYLRGSKKPESQSSMAAVLVAVKAATGSTQLNVGGTLGLRYVGDGVPTQRGKNPPKLYEARYVAPSVNLDGGGNQWAGQQQQVAQDRRGFAQAAAGAQGGGQGWGGNQPQQGTAQAGWGGPPAPGQGVREQTVNNGQPQYARPEDDPQYAAYLAYQQSLQQGGQG